MTYIITALHAEARAFLDAYPFKRIDTLPFPLYEHEDILLAVTQIGNDNAMLATSALLAYRLPNENDILLNVGICGAPARYDIGTLLVIHKITHNNHNYYPDMLLSHPFEESALISVDRPQSDPLETPIDMEAYGVFKAASRFMQLHQMLFIKIVSDHFEPENVSKEKVLELITAKMPQIQSLIQSQKNLFHATSLYDKSETEMIDTFKIQLSKSQCSQLDDALCYFRLKEKRPLHVSLFDTKHLKHKRERGETFEQLISTLYQ